MCSLKSEVGNGPVSGSSRLKQQMASLILETVACLRRSLVTKEGTMPTDSVYIQRAYYARTAGTYDEMHDAYEDNHGYTLAEHFMISVVEHLGIRSILDIGCGTGRVIQRIKEKMPNVKILGIEPSRELRDAAYEKGLSKAEVADGDAMNLAFGDGSVDLVCEFGVLHHIATPSKAVSEMLRVSRKAIFITDNNNFGEGSKYFRLLKQAINAAGLWRFVDWIKTGGKGYSITELDGLAYSYSVFNDYKQIARSCQSVHMLNTVNSGPNLYRTASRVAMLGIKG
jgi:ubiquinone/menaquinone biosynthesis C-methylase UbiE